MTDDARRLIESVNWRGQRPRPMPGYGTCRHCSEIVPLPWLTSRNHLKECLGAPERNH